MYYNRDMFEIAERFREQLMFVNTANNLRVFWVSVTNDKESDLVFYSLITQEHGKNVATKIDNIEDWLITTPVTPVNWKTSEFVENIAPTTTYHLFETCIGPLEQVLARFTFDGNKEVPANHWEVVYENNQYGTQEVQFVEDDFFKTSFTPADALSKKYAEFITSVVFRPSVLALPTLSEELVENELRLPCDCYTHELSVLYDEETDMFELAYWQRGRGEQPWSWKTRFKMIWDILTTGNPYSDMIILKRKNMYKLHDYIEGFMRNAK